MAVKIEGFVVKTRYGKETHWSSAGSSVTICGVWLRASAQYFRVRGAKLPTCEKCNTPQWNKWHGAEEAAQ